MKRLCILIGLVISILAAGCTTPPRPYTEDELMTFESGCARYAPDPEYDECLARQRTGRSDCYGLCFGLSSCYDRCDHAWGARWCSRTTACVEGSYRFTPGAQPDLELGVACRAAMDNSRGCGVTFEGDPCATFERTERREATAVYQCFADLRCDEDRTACGTPVPPYELARHFCDLARPAGYECTPELTAWLDASDGWLRDDVAAAMYECAPATGADRLRCLNAWLGAISSPL